MYENSDTIATVSIFLAAIFAAVAIFSIFFCLIFFFVKEVSESTKETMDSWKRTGDKTSDLCDETISLIHDEERHKRIRDHSENIIANGISRGLSGAIDYFLNRLGYKPRNPS